MEYKHEISNEFFLKWVDKCISFIYAYCPDELKTNALNLLCCSIARSKYLTLANMDVVISIVPDNKKMWYYLSLNKNLIAALIDAKSIQTTATSRSKLFQSCFASRNVVESVNPLSFQNKHWLCCCISQNPGLTIDILLQYPQFDWDWEDVSSNCGIGMDDIESCIAIFPWNWSGISRNVNLTIDMVLKHPHERWNMKYVSMNNGIHMTDIINHENLMWDWNGIVRNINFEFFMVELFPNVIWNMYCVSRHPNLKLENVLSNPNMKWNWEAISKNPSIDLNLLLANSSKPWYWHDIGKNPSVNLDIINSHPAAPWNWNSLSENNGVTMEIILAYPDKEWNYGLLFQQRFITTDGSFNQIFCPEEYIAQGCCLYNLISMHDEDYGRGKEFLDYENVVDLVIQNQYTVACIAEYVMNQD